MAIKTDRNNNLSDLFLQLGGVAPNVIRELSGIYPTFASAFKELTSNAYDADASLVEVELSHDFSEITIRDNGNGMTPFELQSEYLRIGGSNQLNRDGLTGNGRQPIGRKGIGGFAIARYCHKIEICSHTNRKVELSEDVQLEQKTDTIRRITFFTSPFATALAPFTKVKSINCGGKEFQSNQYLQDRLEIEFTKDIWSQCRGQSIYVQFEVDCQNVDVRAAIDYDYLLNLEDNKNIETIEDFCYVSIKHHTISSQPRFTSIKLSLKEFVQSELKSFQRKGRVRNIVSTSGLNRFLWHLSQSAPLPYKQSQNELILYDLEKLNNHISPLPFSITVKVANNETYHLKRHFLESIDAITPESIATRQVIDIDTNGLTAYGYILAFKQPIYPAELRGIAVRVRGVEIGPRDFLRIENNLPARYRPLLNQVVGEIIVLDGLDAINAITPGRQSFYNEHINYKYLHQHLVGDGIYEFGALGQVLNKLWEINSVESSVTRMLQEARQRRNALLNISQAVTSLSLSSRYSRPLRNLFMSSNIVANGLTNIPEYTTQLPCSFGDFKLELSDETKSNYELDEDTKVIKINQNTDIWDKSLYILGRDFQVSLRNGGPDDPICEIDFSIDTIYINWMHPTRSKMGDAMFLKSALFWRIAFLAANNNADMMMDIAHRLLTYTT